MNKTTLTYEFYLLTEPLILLDIWFLILYTDVMKTNKEIINDMIKHFEGLDIVKSEDIPDISLYMDQMTRSLRVSNERRMISFLQKP